MIVPDLEREKAFWWRAFELDDDWTITMVYADEVHHPGTGQAAWGLCNRRANEKRAEIIIRRPRTATDLAQVHETIAHEMLHCLFPNDGITEQEEERIVWKVAPLLADLRTQAPQRARVLARAMARPEKVLLVHRARAEVDNVDIKSILVALCKGLLEMSAMPDEAKALIQTTLEAAEKEGAPPGETEPPLAQDKPPPEALAGKPPEDKPPMGMTEKPEEERYRALVKAQAEDRAAAVDRVLKTRADLTEKQRARLREIGIEKGLARLDADLDELVPAPKPSDATTESRARMGVDKPPRGGAAGPPSADKALNMRFRIFDNPESDGVTICDAMSTGRLVELDHFAAFPLILKGSRELVADQRAKARGAK